MTEEPTTTTEPFKFVGALVACEKDAEGNIVREFEAGKLVIYAAQFGDLKEIVEAAWAEAEREGAKPPGG